MDLFYSVLANPDYSKSYFLEFKAQRVNIPRALSALPFSGHKVQGHYLFLSATPNRMVLQAELPKIRFIYPKEVFNLPAIQVDPE